MTQKRWIGLIIATLALSSAGLLFFFWPRTLDLHPRTQTLVPERIGPSDILTQPRMHLVSQIAEYDNEFLAYLMFNYLRGSAPLSSHEVFLVNARTDAARTDNARKDAAIVYRVQVHLPNDLLGALSILLEAKSANLIGDLRWSFIPQETLEGWRLETSLVQTAYSQPPTQKLEEMSRTELIAYIRRFVRFKSITDPRIRRGIEPIPTPLTSAEARQLAEDIVSVADFFKVPLDFFLGIGAMENNYMNVEGDLQHAVWKRRVQKGDIVLKRTKDRALVVNSALGVWQITRETLRYSHSLYLKDRRDYAQLAEHLRPPKELDFENLKPEVLTTYAGLLFRDLIDRCGGDVHVAVGAYNGGLDKPNLRYAEGVTRIADYARRMIEHAAVLNSPVPEMRFPSASR